MVNYSFLLIIYLSFCKCASTKDQSEIIQAETSEKHTSRDIFSRHLSEQLLHKVLQYDAKSTGRMAKANRALQKLAVVTRTFRYFEGAGWDMPELANICEFGVTDAKNRPQLEAELAKIMSFSHIKDEASFNYHLTNLLLTGKFFKELAVPVLKYLVRRFYARKEHIKDKDGSKRQKFLIFAVQHRVFDVFFELSKDSSVWNRQKLEDIVKGDIHDCFYFDCYNNYVYGNLTAKAYMQTKLTKIDPTDYGLFCNFTSGGEKFSHIELYSWAAVCIYRRVSEDSYTQHLSKIPIVFLDIIQECIYKYSLITFDDDEKDYFHGLIRQLLEKYFENDTNLKPHYNHLITFTKLLNDFRFGSFDYFFYDNRISPLEKLHCDQIAMLCMAASKANKKSLVKQLAKHPNFYTSNLEYLVECKCPQSFKVYFDIIENEPLQYLSGNTNYANTKLIKTIVSNDFKIISTVTEPFGATFIIQSPVEYIKLGFASTYEIVLEPEDQFLYGRSLIEKMLNGSAKSGAEDFVRLITEHCGDHVYKPNLLSFYKLNVSYEVIQLLLEHQELIKMLDNRMLELRCYDKRINPEEIENFKHLIKC